MSQPVNCPPNVSINHFFMMVSAAIGGRMANMDMHQSTSSEWSRRDVIREAINDVHAVLSDAHVEIMLPFDQEITSTFTPLDQEELLDKVYKMIHEEIGK